MRLAPGQTLDARLRAAVPELLPGLGGWWDPGRGRRAGGPAPQRQPRGTAGLAQRNLLPGSQASAPSACAGAHHSFTCAFWIVAERKHVPLRQATHGDFARRQQSHGDSGIASNAISVLDLPLQL